VRPEEGGDDDANVRTGNSQYLSTGGKDHFLPKLVEAINHANYIDAISSNKIKLNRIMLGVLMGVLNKNHIIKAF